MMLIQMLVSGLVGALLATLLNWLLHRRDDKIAQKRDVLRRFFGYRYHLTNSAHLRKIAQNGEPFVALNEALVVFSDCPDVIDALNTMRRDLGQENGRLVANILSLTKAMAQASNISLSGFDDDFLMGPFSPPP